MQSANSDGCRGCQGASLLPADRGAFGSCPHCIAAAVAGTVIGWSSALAAWVFYPRPGVLVVAVLLSCGFSLLLGLHVTGYARRKAGSA